jgi:hypothetical protein
MTTIHMNSARHEGVKASPAAPAGVKQGPPQKLVAISAPRARSWSVVRATSGDRLACILSSQSGPQG